MTLGEHQEVFSQQLAKLIIEAARQGYGVRIGEVFRTPEQQELYLQTGKSKTQNSMHLKKCAADLHFTKHGVIEYPDALGQFWCDLDPLNEWGGFWHSFQDKPHFQRTVK